VAVVHKVSLQLLRVDDLIEKNANSKLWELLMQDFPLNRLGAIEQLITSPSLEKSLAYTGAVVTKDGKTVATSGECPSVDVLEAIGQKVSKMSGSTHHTSKLAEDFGLPTTLLGGFAGMMSIQFEDIAVLFFRKSFRSELKWRNATPESFEKDTNLPRFSPAGSFQFFIQEFQNQSRPWSAKDIAFAKVVADWISEDFES
jgi:light-regulated signal transduction histidine kinase (bacteriophytochrome)